MILHKNWQKSSILANISEMSSEKSHTKGVAFNHFQGDRYRYLWQEQQLEKKSQLLPSSQQLHLEKKKITTAILRNSWSSHIQLNS